ncbi:MAG: TonB family protein [Deltaproteobacteria bacterium]|nr:TonB family protein [Deltaproteobacteria bacterium]
MKQLVTQFGATIRGWQRHSTRRHTVAIVAALLFNLSLLGLIAISFAPPDQKAGKRVATRQFSKSDFQKNRQALTPEQLKRRQELQKELAEKKKEEEKKKDQEELAKLDNAQIVDLPASPDQSAPKNAKFLSEFNTNTKKETKSRHRTSDYKRATNEVTGLVQQPNPMQGDAAAAAQKDQAAVPKKNAKKAEQAAMEVPTVEKRDRLELSIDNAIGMFHNKQSSEEAKGNSNRLLIKPGEAEQAEQEGKEESKAAKINSPKDLIPSVGVLAKIAGAPANDFLPDDIADGEGTFLNSREFKFAPFFNRLKQSVSQHWKPLNEFRRRDPSGNIYGYQSRVTIVSVRLNESGEVTNVEVARSSGVDFLDKEAISAFKRAQPFPNPPKQLMKDGQTEFTFGFHIEFNAKNFGFDF